VISASKRGSTHVVSRFKGFNDLVEKTGLHGIRVDCDLGEATNR